jgi:hypothetical protein
MHKLDIPIEILKNRSLLQVVPGPALEAAKFPRDKSAFFTLHKVLLSVTTILSQKLAADLKQSNCKGSYVHSQSTHTSMQKLI